MINITLFRDFLYEETTHFSVYSIYVHIYIYICMYVHVCSMYMYVVCTYVHVCSIYIYVCMYMYVHVCMYVCNTRTTYKYL